MNAVGNMSNKFAWKWTIKPEYVDEYVEMHIHPWREIMEAHSKAGIKNYSIFQNGNEFFYCFECDDVKNAFNIMAKSKICAEWDKITEKMIEGGYEIGNELDSIDPMREVFYLK